MNLQGRTASGLLTGAALLLLGCENPSAIGLELNPNENNVATFEKEFVLPSSVILYDSVNTTSDSRLLVGKFQDPLFGTVTAKSFSQISRDGEEGLGIIALGEVDSVMFNFEVNYVHGIYGAFFQTINIRQLTDTLYSAVSYFADDTTNYNTRNLVASKKFFYSPTNDTIIRIKADPTWAIEFFRLISEGVSNSKLQEQIKGFAILPGNDNTLVFGFEPANSKIVLHYHLPDGTDSLSYQLNFDPTSDTRYNSIVADRSGTELEILREKGDEFVPTSGKIYLQPATGVFPKFSIVEYREFVAGLGNVVINRAEIIVGAVDPVSSPDFRIQPPQRLRFIFGNESNKIIGGNIILQSRIADNVVVTDDSYLSFGNKFALVATYDTVTVPYTNNLPTIFFQQLRDSVLDVNDLIIYPEDVSSLNRFVISRDSVRLKIYYTNLN